MTLTFLRRSSLPISLLIHLSLTTGIIIVALVFRGITGGFQGRKPDAVGFIDTPAMAAIIDSKTVLIIDARPALFYGLGHIPGSCNMPASEFDSRYERIGRDELAKAQRIIVYCSGPHCDDALTIGQRLIRLNLRHVEIYSGGWEEWEAYMARRNTER
jgi:3-mercaptopyruvate sulfurtransferase SseA